MRAAFTETCVPLIDRERGSAELHILVKDVAVSNGGGAWTVLIERGQRDAFIVTFSADVLSPTHHIEISVIITPSPRRVAWPLAAASPTFKGPGAPDMACDA